ncbi:uncharacterized protein ACRADG_008155 [Cochliomyia hominivorax]
MKFLIIFILSIFLISTANANGIIGHDSDTSLLNFMARSNDLLLQDPTRSLNCFNYYIPKINEIAKQYEANFKACLNESEASRNKTDDATYGERKDLATAAEASCALFTECFSNESVEGVFQCYIDGGAANIQTMYGINANASRELANLRENYYLIEAQEFRCTNETKRAYERESTEAYAHLNSCILGQSEIPTEAPPTTTTEKATNETTPPVGIKTTYKETPSETTTAVPESIAEHSDTTTWW